MLKALQEQEQMPDIGCLGFMERLGLLVDREITERDSRRLADRLRLAKLKQAACLEDLDLHTRRFILGWKQAGLEQKLGARIVNYADDLVICCKGNAAETALAAMRQMMTRLKLTVNEDKTRTCRLPGGEFDFLGYTFGRRYSPKTGRLYIATRPSKKSIKRMIEAVHFQTGRDMGWLDAEEMVARLNRKLRGWANYFCLGRVTPAYRFIDRYTTTRLRRWLCKKHKWGSKGFKRQPDEYMYQHLGLIRLPKLPQGFPWAKT